MSAAWLTLFDETFLGKPEAAGGTWFVEKSEAIFPLIEGMSAGQASVRVSGKVSTVAAQVRHTAYYLHLANLAFAGSPVSGEWESSWSVQEVDDLGWLEIKSDLQREFRELRARLADPAFEPAEGDAETYVWANLAHAAFHLGAIRQLSMLLES